VPISVEARKKALGRVKAAEARKGMLAELSSLLKNAKGLSS